MRMKSTSKILNSKKYVTKEYIVYDFLYIKFKTHKTKQYLRGCGTLYYLFNIFTILSLLCILFFTTLMSDSHVTYF